MGLVLQNRYRIMAQLGQGGMGSVYQAWDTRLNIPVALKEMLPQEELPPQLLEDLRQQFQREAVILARLDHPHLVSVIDFFEEKGNAYLVMKYVEGENLDQRIERLGPLPEDEVVEIAAQMLDALSYCHSQGIIHRDIKPQNIIIRSDGQALLVDFGLVKMWDPNDPRTRTAMRGMGSPQYAPPEQYGSGMGHTEPRSDLYSLGATMYHALTGIAPPAVTSRIAEPAVYRPIRAVVSGVSDRTARAVQTAMELQRDKRWISALEMADALDVAITDWEARLQFSSNQLTAGMSRGGTRRMTTGSLRARRRRKSLVWLWVSLGALAFLLGGMGFIFRDKLFGSPAALTPDLTPTISSQPTATSTKTLTPFPTDTPTPMVTATPEPSATLTKTPKPTATSRSTVTPRATETTDPTETLSSSPSPSPTPPRHTPTPKISPSATSSVATFTPQPVTAGALINFEAMENWQRGDQPNGELVQTQEQVKSGSYAAKLIYNFPATQDDYVVFLKTYGVSGQPNMLGAWVYGDGSGHFLNLWVKDTHGEVWSVHLGQVGAGGWRQMSGVLAPGQNWPSGHISGPDNGIVDYPVSFYALVLDRPERGNLSGQIYIDDISVWRSSALPATAVPATAPVAPTTTSIAPTAPPPPSGEVGRIIFTVKVDDTLNLYTTDPAWSQMSPLGQTDYGHSTCGGTTASTLVGVTYNGLGVRKCETTTSTDVCPSPDGNYKVIINVMGGGQRAILVQTVADGTEKFYYQGPLSTEVGIIWSGNSRYFLFAVDRTVNIIQVGTEGYRQVIPFIENAWPPQFSPDSSMVLYLKPVGGEGASDVCVVNLDGTGELNLTNAPIAYKMCPRWRY
ncbi:MAG: protein kinase [Anaerolineae bacterium]|nr:protein kinase [Anaerolineae bacterium]